MTRTLTATRRGPSIAFAIVLPLAASGLAAAVGYLPVLGAIICVCVLFIAIVHPRIALLLWVVAFAFVPFWVGVTTPFYLPPTSLVGILILGACLYKNKWKLNTLDLAVLLFTAGCLICGILGLSRAGDVTNVITQWFLSYLVDRLLVQRTGLTYVYSLIAIVMTIVAACAVFEFFTNINPYYSWVVNNSQFLAWGYEQDRGGIVRAEWAFGHSIALGCSLAMSIPFIAATDFSARIKVLMYGIVMVGAIVSFSRSGGLTAVLALTLVILFYRDRIRNRGRLLVIGSMIVIAWFAVPQIAKVFGTEGRQATISSDYRLTLTQLIPSMNIIGLADGYVEPRAGEFYFQGFRSIDSTFILLGVSFGYIFALATLLGFAVLLAKVLRGTHLPAAISLVSVVPALFTVALITQFGSFVWFVAGVLSLELADARRRSRNAPATASMTSETPRVQNPTYSTESIPIRDESVISHSAKQRPSQ